MPRPHTMQYQSPDELEIQVNRMTPAAVLHHPMRLSAEVQSVRHLAWAKANWFEEARGVEGAKNAADIIYGRPWGQLAKLGAAALTPRGNTYYTAQHGRRGRHVLATGCFMHEVPGEPPLRWAKQLLTPDFACIRSVDVHPRWQQRGFGLAMMHTGLMGFDPDMPTSVFMSNNSRLQKRFSIMGFHRTGSQERAELFGTAPDAVRQVRMQGPPVGEFLETLRRHYGWLAHGRRDDKFS